MELYDAIQSRRSIRKFKDDPVSDEQISELLRAGTLAPSSKNRQQWGFIVARSDMKDRIASLTEESGRRSGQTGSVIETCRVIREASALILICHRVSSGYLRGDMLSIGACMENICLRAVDMGLGALWICDIDVAQEEIGRELGREEPIISAIAVGYPDEAPSPRPRISAEKLTEWR